MQPVLILMDPTCVAVIQVIQGMELIAMVSFINYIDMTLVLKSLRQALGRMPVLLKFWVILHYGIV